MAGDSLLREFAFPMNGKLITAFDGSTIGPNFKLLKNYRPKGAGKQCVGGMTKINTTAITTYTKVSNGHHFRKEQPVESHILVQAYNSAETAYQVLENKTAVPDQGDFEATPLYADADVSSSGAGQGRFSNAPSGDVVYCDGAKSKIWGGDEKRVARFITYDPADTFRFDYTNLVQNTLSDANNVAALSVVGAGIDANTKLLLDLDTDFTDTSGNNNTFTAVDDAAIATTAPLKFGVGYANFDGTGDWLTKANEADLAISGGAVTIDLWVYTDLTQTGCFWSHAFETGTLDYASFEHDTNGAVHYKLFFTTQTDFSISTANSVLTANTWHHVEFTQSGDDHYIFIDGVQQATGSTTDRPGDDNAFDSVHYIGATYNGTATSNPYKGRIDELRFSNIARHVAGFDVETTAYASTATAYLYVGSTRPLKGIKFYISTPNATSGTSSVYYWDGSGWATVGSLADGTASGGVPFAQTGSMTFTSTVTTAKIKAIDQIVLYWYRITVSAVDTTTKISQVTVDAPFQDVVDIWDGVHRNCLSFRVQKVGIEDYTLGVLNEDYSTNADGTGISGTFADLGSLTASTQYILAGFAERIMGINFLMVAGQTNATANTVMTVQYWNGNTWVNVSGLDDGTVEDGISLAKSGMATWSPPAITAEFLKESFPATFTVRASGRFTNSSGALAGALAAFAAAVNEVPDSSLTETKVATVPLYYYKISFSQATDATVKVDSIGGVATSKVIAGFKFPFMADNALFLCSETSGDKNAAIRSLNYAPDAWNGDSTEKFFFGDETELLAAGAFYSQKGSSIFSVKVFLKRNEMWGMTGSSVRNYSIYNISETDGIAAPLTLRTAKISTDKGAIEVLIWQGSEGIQIFDNVSPKIVSKDIENFWDERESNTRKLHASYAHLSTASINETYNEYRWCFADGTSTGTLNREFALNLTTLEFYEIDRGTGKRLQVSFEVVGTTGIKQEYGAIDTGYLERLENGTDFDGNAIVQEFQFGDLVLHEDSLMTLTSVRYIKLISVANTVTANERTITHYGDTKTSSTSFTVSPQKSGERLAHPNKSHNLGNHIFHSFKSEITTNDETYGDQPLYLTGYYKVEGEDRR